MNKLQLQGEALRQSLLTRYYGKDHPRGRNDSGMGGAVTPVTAGGPGSVILSRAEMTLHDVQVSLDIHCFLYNKVYVCNIIFISC